MKKGMFETASFHIVKPCNMKCKFCYATYENIHVVEQLSIGDAKMVLWKLREAGLQKITFAGGEPMLYKSLDWAIQYAKSIGLTTSIITNGSLITNEWLQKMKGTLDWIGISIDSLNPQTNSLIGRVDRKWNLKSREDYLRLCEMVKANGFKLKINTVVNAYNKNEDMNGFINYTKPKRWKVFQALRVQGQNDEHWDEIKVSDKEFDAFVARHKSCLNIVPENNAVMGGGAYLLIDPLGRLFEDSKGYYSYSQPLCLMDTTVESCLNEINLNRDVFLERGGIYNW